MRTTAMEPDRQLRGRRQPCHLYYDYRDNLIAQDARGTATLWATMPKTT